MNDRTWHETEYLGDVRYWMNSGKHLLALSFSGFDPGCAQSGPISDMGSQGLEPIACPLSLAAPLQSARLQTSVRHFLWAQRGGPWPPGRSQP